MIDHSRAKEPDKVEIRLDNIPSINDCTDEVQSLQSVWVEERRTSVSPGSIVQDSEASANKSNVLTTAPSSPNTQANPETKAERAEKEGFGEFVTATTNPFKQFISYKVEDNENLPLLNIESDPDTQRVFEGIGLVESGFASLDTSTLALRRAGKLVLRKTMIERKDQNVQSRASYIAQRVLLKLPVKTDDDMKKAPSTPVVPKDFNEYLEKPKSVDPLAYLNGLIRPVSWAKHSYVTDHQKCNEEIEDLVAAEISF